MAFSVNQLLTQIDPLSLSLGMALGGIPLALTWILTHQRRQQQTLVLSLNLEQCQRLNRQQEEHLVRLEHERDSQLAQLRQLERDNSSLRASLGAAQRQLVEREQLFKELRQRIDEDFTRLASQVFSNQGQELRRLHGDRLDSLLGPLREQLQDFRSRIDEVYDRESRDRVAISTEISQLKQLNERIAKDAVNLTNALTSRNKRAGIWGEMVLERLLEGSGLRPGSEFELQPSFHSPLGTVLRPDAIIHLPEDRHILIDAKVTLKAFVETHGATEPEQRRRHLEAHLAAVRRHIGTLSGKQYQQLTAPDGLDFILLFLPVEGAFQLVIEEAPELLEAAMRQKVILTSPSTLLAILRTIHHLWRLDEQNRNGLIIAKKAGNLYDKFVGFTEAFEEIGFRLTQTEQAWHTARNRLTTGQGNILARTEELKTLGVQASKDLPPSLSNPNTP